MLGSETCWKQWKQKVGSETCWEQWKQKVCIPFQPNFFIRTSVGKQTFNHLFK